MKELLARLQKLGLSQYESRAYVALLKSPRVTAYELARQSGIPPSKIYEVVEKLLQKELVVTVEEGGFARYVPLEPREAIARYRRVYNEVIDYVDGNLQQIYKADHGGAAYVWSLGNRPDIMVKAVEMIEGATDEIYLGVWPHEIPYIEEPLRRAEARGTRVAICLYGELALDIGVVFQHPIDPVVMRDQGSRRMVLAIDRREALVAYFPEVGDATAHWSANIGFVQMTKDYVRHDIWIIKVVRRFEPLINEVYGPTRERLRDVFAPEPPPVVRRTAPSPEVSSVRS